MITLEITQGIAYGVAVKSSVDLIEVVLISDLIGVSLLLNDEWATMCIDYRYLSAFVETEEMNVFAHVDYRGELIERVTTLDVDTFVKDNLEECVLAYLQSGKGVLNVA